MFGVTTPCVQPVAASQPTHDCLVFHAIGTGGQAMEKLVDSGLLPGVIDVTTTEVCDLLMGGVFPAEDSASARSSARGMPYVGVVRRARHGEFRRARDTVPDALSRPQPATCTIRR